jgi:hypothetical protein
MNKPTLLRNPQFLTGLLVLLLNDLVLKPSLHNWFTGKLSDFAGLYIFPVFLCHFFPAYRRHIYWLVAVLFAFWKSSMSDGLVGFLHSIHVPFDRVTDLTDLVALVALPWSYYWCTRTVRWGRPATLATGVLALVIFCGDSVPMRMLTGPVAEYEKHFSLPTSLTEAQLVSKLNERGIKCVADSTIYGNYYYDTSDYANKKIVYDNRTVVHFWRIRNYVAGAEAIRNINFRYKTNTTGSFVEIQGFDVSERAEEGRVWGYRKTRKRYMEVLKTQFAEVVK